MPNQLWRPPVNSACYKQNTVSCTIIRCHPDNKSLLTLKWHQISREQWNQGARPRDQNLKTTDTEKPSPSPSLPPPSNIGEGLTAIETNGLQNWEPTARSESWGGILNIFDVESDILYSSRDSSKHDDMIFLREFWTFPCSPWAQALKYKCINKYYYKLKRKTYNWNIF